MRIAIGGDHGGFELKRRLVALLRRRGDEVADLGCHSPAACDYPVFGYKVAQAVASREFDRGILICKSGNGIAMVANKVPGIRAAICHDAQSARLSRQHNDANLLVLGAEMIPAKRAETIVEAWLAAAFEGGRHARRVQQIAKIEQEIARHAQPSRRRS
ncbi:MAG: ribose 5-phosphate isomerase B [Candidatus Omnitrophica bacterium]|nr:ribose 5-phosphate isomerase B [Candidatus Omnitrophota bacterium]